MCRQRPFLDRQCSGIAFAYAVFLYSSQNLIVVYIIQMYSLVKCRVNEISQPFLVGPATLLELDK